MKNLYTCSWLNWHDIPWKHCNETVAQLQEQIAVAYTKKDLQTLASLEEKLVTSPEACAVAVLSTNPGTNTPGTDNIVWDKEALGRVPRTFGTRPYKALPVRRVYIPKRTGKLRPLGIPTMFDRAVQSLWALYLLPIAECTGDRNSYGYRPYRSTRD